MKLTIKGGLSPHSTRVFLGDMEISEGLREVVLRIDWQEVNKAIIRIDVDEVEVDAQVIAMLNAHLKSEVKP